MTWHNPNSSQYTGGCDLHARQCHQQHPLRKPQCHKSATAIYNRLNWLPAIFGSISGLAVGTGMVTRTLCRPTVPNKPSESSVPDEPDRKKENAGRRSRPAQKKQPVSKMVP